MTNYIILSLRTTTGKQHNKTKRGFLNDQVLALQMCTSVLMSLTAQIRFEKTQEPQEMMLQKLISSHLCLHFTQNVILALGTNEGI